MANKKNIKHKSPKAKIYKRWWFWVVAVLAALGLASLVLTNFQISSSSGKMDSQEAFWR